MKFIQFILILLVILLTVLTTRNHYLNLAEKSHGQESTIATVTVPTEQLKTSLELKYQPRKDEYVKEQGQDDFKNRLSEFSEKTSNLYILYHCDFEDSGHILQDIESANCRPVAASIDENKLYDKNIRCAHDVMLGYPVLNEDIEAYPELIDGNVYIIEKKAE